jgi:hypothetical protein
MVDRARWFRRYVLATVVGLVVLALPMLWFALVRAYLSGTWAVTLRFNALGEGPAELVLVSVLVPASWLALIALHELLRETAE